MSAANASAPLLPLEAGAGGHGCSACGAEMEVIYALTFRVCSRACGSASEALDPCMPGRGEIKDEQTLETPHPSLRPLVFLILWDGRIHAQLLLLSSSLETPCASILLLRSCCLWEKHQENPRPLLWVRVLPTTLYLKRAQEGWAAAAHGPLALLHLIQGTWKPFSHHPPTPLSHLPRPTGMPERGYLFSQTSQFIPDTPLLTWMG